MRDEEIAFRAFGQTAKLAQNRGLGVARFFMQRDHSKVAWAVSRRILCDFGHIGEIVLPQFDHDRAAESLGNRCINRRIRVVAAQNRFDTVEARGCFRGFRARRRELVVEDGERLIADENAAGAHNAVFGLVTVNRLFIRPSLPSKLDQAFV